MNGYPFFIVLKICALAELDLRGVWRPPGIF
jgi:hypothetical protein